jgi:hypothetical protein
MMPMDRRKICGTGFQPVQAGPHRLGRTGKMPVPPTYLLKQAAGAVEETLDNLSQRNEKV